MDALIQILIAVGVMAVIALVVGLLLAVAAKKFAVEKDERIEKIEGLLPGANCGGCGYAGCSAYAAAMVEKGEAPNRCAAGGPAVASAVAEILGVVSEDTQRMRAQVMCSGAKGLAARKYKYTGLEDCYSVAKLGNGPKECPWGCIGLGSCVKACPFGAIKIEHGVAVVEYEKCKACGVCVSTCPRHIIKLVPYDSDIWVGCTDRNKGAVTRGYCKVGCIGCGLCAKVCNAGAITVEDNHAVIDYSKCVGCGACVEKCPRKIIWSGKDQVMFGDTIHSMMEAKKAVAKPAKPVKKVKPADKAENNAAASEKKVEAAVPEKEQKPAEGRHGEPLAESAAVVTSEALSAEKVAEKNVSVTVPAEKEAPVAVTEKKAEAAETSEAENA